MSTGKGFKVQCKMVIHIMLSKTVFLLEKKKVFLALLCFYISDFDLLTLMVSFRNEKTSESIRDHDIKLCEIFNICSNIIIIA